MKYRVQLCKMLWTTVEVDADDRNGAIDAALGSDLPTLCAQCTGWGRSWYIDDSEWDFPDDANPDDNEWVEEVVPA